jgi:hypothetical protein
MTRVLITRSLLVSKSNQKYNDELKKEQVMNKAAEATAEGAEVARKRKAEEAEGPRQRSNAVAAGVGHQVGEEALGEALLLAAHRDDIHSVN